MIYQLGERKMRRSGQQISEEKCIEVLKSQVRGVLSVHGDDGYPYGLPISYWYDEKNGKICFHGSRVGHKVDSINANNKVSFCVFDEGYRKEGEWPLHFNSVIVFGRIAPVENPTRVREICANMVAEFTDDPEYLEKEMKAFGSKVLCLEITPELMTGKRVKES